jgi:hypothetical protein
MLYLIKKKIVLNFGRVPPYIIFKTKFYKNLEILEDVCHELLYEGVASPLILTCVYRRAQVFSK